MLHYVITTLKYVLKKSKGTRYTNLEVSINMEGTVSLVVMLVVFGGIFYFLLIRPQRKQQKEHEELVENLEEGNDIITAGGIHGSIIKVEDDQVLLRIEDGTVMRIEKDSVSERL